MLETFGNILKVKELRTKLLVTLLLLVVFRVGRFIPVPGIDIAALQQQVTTFQEKGEALGKVFNLADMFTGGALAAGAIFGLGVMPYISASIIFQLLTAIVPSLERLSREGPTGRKKIQQLTRVSTVILCVIQAGIITSQLYSKGGEIILPEVGKWEFYLYGVLSLTVGTMFLMWLGEQIDEFGIGNGISLLIMGGIISRLPNTLADIRNEFTPGAGGTGTLSVLHLVLLVLLFVGMILAVVLITLGQRRIPVQYAKATRGRKVYGGQRSYLPLRVNSSGVIAIIFAQSLLYVPQILLAAIAPQSWANLFQYGSFLYMTGYVVLIIFFSYFYTAITFNPTEVADNLKQNGCYIMGIRPGRRTAEHLEKIMTRITLAGSVFLCFVALMPFLVTQAMGIPMNISSFLGGTGLLIVVGVALDVVQRVESFLLMKHYEGLGPGGRRMRGRRR